MTHSPHSSEPQNFAERAHSLPTIPACQSEVIYAHIRLIAQLDLDNTGPITLLTKTFLPNSGRYTWQASYSLDITTTHIRLIKHIASHRILLNQIPLSDPNSLSHQTIMELITMAEEDK